MKFSVQCKEVGSDRWEELGTVIAPDPESALAEVPKFAFMKMAEDVFRGERVLAENMRNNDEWRLIEKPSLWKRLKAFFRGKNIEYVQRGP